jgi:hypothetical protein
MSATQQPEYLTSHPACVEEVDHLTYVLAEMVALAGDIGDDLLTGDQAWHRLQVLVNLALARPSVRQARQRGGAR